MRPHSLYFLVGIAAATVSALENGVVGRDGFENVASAIAAVVSPLQAAKQAAGIAIRNDVIEDYDEVFPDYETGQGVAEIINGDEPPVLPGNCEYKVQELQQSCDSAAIYYESREQAKEVAKQRQFGEPGISVQPEVDRIIEDQVWILRSYLHCCAVLNDGRGSDHYENRRRDLADVAVEASPAQAAGAAPPPAFETSESILKGLDSSPAAHEYMLKYDATAPCEDRKSYLSKWLENYYQWAAEADKYTAEEVPKLKPDENAIHSHLVLHKELALREKLVRGYKRCCRDQPHPGPAPTGTNPFPSIAEVAKFGNY